MKKLYDWFMKKKYELWIFEIVSIFLNLARSEGFEIEVKDEIAKKKWMRKWVWGLLWLQLAATCCVVLIW